jgi:hypothetical protein
VDEKYLNFGEVWEDSTFSFKLPVRNEATDHVQVHEFARSCSCVDIQPTSLGMAPGEVATLTITLDLRRGMSTNKSSWTWPFQAEIHPLIAGQPAQGKPWVLKGQVKKLLDLSPPIVSFGNELTRGQPYPIKTVKVFSVVELDDLLAACDAEKASVRVSRDGPQQFHVTITPAATVNSGPLAIDLSLQPVRKRVPAHLPGKMLKMQGFLHDEVEAVPGAIAVGALPTGSSFSETVCLRSRASRPFFVEKWNTNSPETRVEHLKMSQVEPCFRIMQQIKTGGPGKCRVVFAVRLSNERQISVPVDVVYHGYEVKRQDR